MTRVAFLALLSTLGALMLASAALAITKTCTSSPCYGTAEDDTLTERRGVKDEIFGRSGDDTIRAGRKERNYPRDKDILHGGPGNDRLNSVDLAGGDVLYGDRGRDVCLVDTGDPHYGCDEVDVRSFPA